MLEMKVASLLVPRVNLLQCLEDPNDAGDDSSYHSIGLLYVSIF